MATKKFVSAAQLKATAQAQKTYVDTKVNAVKNDLATEADQADIDEITALFDVAEEGE